MRGRRADARARLGPWTAPCSEPRPPQCGAPSGLRTDRAAVHAVLDDALVAHVAFVDGGQPFVIPMVFGRIDDTLYLHGAVGARVVRRLAAGAPVCVTVTHVDALVLAKAQVHHSANYRSRRAPRDALRRVAGTEAERALAAIVDHALPGPFERGPSADARASCGARACSPCDIDEGSLKVRAHGPVDDETDPAWTCGRACCPSSPRPRPRSPTRSSARFPFPLRSIAPGPASTPCAPAAMAAFRRSRGVRRGGELVAVVGVGDGDQRVAPARAPTCRAARPRRTRSRCCRPCS